MASSIQSRVENVSRILVQLAEECFERSCLSKDSLKDLFHKDAYGNLGFLPSVAKNIVETFMETSGYGIALHEVLEEYLNFVDFSV